MSAIAQEVNFDGIVGPTHNYAGLSHGNFASMQNIAAVSSPKRAALEGLAKMKFMMGLGLKQAVLPPHERPHIPTLRRLGFDGSDADVLASVARIDRRLLASVSSASAMWAANAATVSPSSDTADHRVHFTPANLLTNLHRSIETPTTARVLRTIFADERFFTHHEPLPATVHFSDEGAANHTRLGSLVGRPGTELFTCGIGRTEDWPTPVKYPMRQAAGAYTITGCRHQLKRSVLVYQNPDAVNAGAFHNDVVAVGHRNVLLYHEGAWLSPEACIEKLQESVADLHAIEVKASEVTLEDAVSSYIFNSQLVTLPDDSIALIAPIESGENARVKCFLDRLLASGGPIQSVHYVDVRQSMRNGGGPACLRLRVVLNEDELAATQQGVFLTNALHDQLKAWIERHYRDELRPADLADPKLLDESRRALDELSAILRLGPIYEFQQ